MNSHVFSLAIIVALCLGHVMCRGIEKRRTFTASLEVHDPWGDCVAQLAESDNLTECDENLFVTKTAGLVSIKQKAYTMELEIGSNKQKFDVMVDTGSATTWVFDHSCEDSDPNCVGHKKYKSGSSTSFTLIDREFEKNYGPVSATGITAEDTVYLADGFPAKKQLFGAITKQTQKIPFDGLLALGFTATKGRPPVFSNAAQDAQMDPIFSLYLKGGGKGEIMFGGLNKAKYDGKTKAVTKIVSQRKYIIMMDEAKFGETELCKKDGKVSCKALVDSGCSSIIGPAAVISPFIKEVLKPVGKKVKCTDVPSFPSLEIKIGGKTLLLESTFYTRQYGDKCYNLLKGKGTMWTLGNPFLAKFYTSFDLKEETITFHVAV